MVQGKLVDIISCLCNLPLLNHYCERNEQRHISDGFPVVTRSRFVGMVVRTHVGRGF